MAASEGLLHDIAKTGKYYVVWTELKREITVQLNQVLDKSFAEKPDLPDVDGLRFPDQKKQLVEVSTPQFPNISTFSRIRDTIH